MRNYGILTSICLVASAAGTAATAVWATPHDSYSSSVGVLGCKINTNRVAYWPGSVDCDNICVKLTYEGRSVHLLRIDQSGGAYDISYDAWNYLQTGESAAVDPISGGTVAMDYEEVDASECAGLIYTDGSKLPLSAANSIDFLVSCLADSSSWVANNYVLYNICDPICTLGFDEVCSLNLATSNQPSCPHMLGLQSKLTDAPVYDIEYPSGSIVEAGSGADAPASVKAAMAAEDGGSGQGASNPTPQASPTGAVFIEQSSSREPASQSSSTSPTGTPTTSYPAVTSSSQSTVSPGTSSSTLQAATLSPVAVSSSQTALAGQYTSSLTTGMPSANVSTTMSTVTASSSPASVSTILTAAAGRVAGGVPVLAMFSSMIIFSILGAL